MRSEARKVDRQIREIQREEGKITRSIKTAAKRGDHDTCKMLAKEIVRSRKACDRLETSKAQMNSVMMNVEMQAAQGAMVARIKDTTGVMKMMNQLTKVEGVQETMRQMQMEMTKAGIMEEMVDDAMEAVDDADDDEAADEEVMKVMTELNAETFETAKRAGTHAVQTQEAAVADDEDDEEEMAAMREKLAALKSS